ncbi:MAG: hypothetical protein UW85_C0001G0033 [Parcubacteria group bacterium GW2011_GWA1_Parcubacteria_45_10]|nr:MAG: hypothetical protein UW85_C0001G0033 [Parcubacteria group bacterium GW2011_GWA1_Parcubacteria_45_10]KKT89304.1 MAG: hypothetical protein UW89_C0001G0032 [Parcubacteria group bacterium GW2011_GWB1_45_10]
MAKRIIDIKVKNSSPRPQSEQELEANEARPSLEDEFLKTITHNSGASAKTKLSKRTPKEKPLAETMISNSEPEVMIPETVQQPFESAPFSVLPKAKKPRRFFKPALIISAVSGLIFAVWAFGSTISRVDIGIETKKETQSQSFRVTFKKPGELGSGGSIELPVYQFEKSFSYTQDYPATGQGQGSSFASGEIVIYNENSASSQILVAGTRFESPDKKIFRLVSRTVVPGYTTEAGKIVSGKISAQLKADQAGPDYNLGPVRFAIPAFSGSAKFNNIYGVSENPFSGGASGLTTAVSADDIKLAKEKITEYAYEKAKSEALSQAPESLKLLDKAVRFDLGKITTSAVGEVAEKLKATISGSLAIFVFDENELKRTIEAKMTETQGFKVDLSSASYQILYENPEVDFEKSTISLTANVKRDLSAVVDTLEFKQKIAGKNIEELKKELLKLEGVQKIRVSVWPFWVRSSPKNIDAIKIQVD